MKIAHFSDTHGLPRKSVPADVDLVIHSGDMLPDLAPTAREERERQEEWVRATIQAWSYWLGDKPMVYVPGNHDFFDPVPLFRAAGLEVYEAQECPRVLGLQFAGLPDTDCSDYYNHQYNQLETSLRLEAMLEYKPEILVCHSPPAGVLDLVKGKESFGGRGRDTRWGSAALRAALDAPGLGAYFCGHVHQSGGKYTRVNNVLVSNAACTMNVLEV